MSSTAAPNPRPPVPVEAPELSCDEVAAWLDEVLAILEATSAVAPLGSMGLRQWAVDQLTPLQAAVPWLLTEIEEADIEDHRFQDALWLLHRAEVVASKLQAHLVAKPPLAA